MPRPARAGREAVVPSTGQAVDVKEAVDVVKAEVEGGEADSASGPTPPSFLWEAEDAALIHDTPIRVARPLGLSPLESLIPAYNPMTAGKLALGKQLFYDQRLSLDATVSCASCHDPAKAWTDNKVASLGINNQIGSRNSPTILNSVYGQSLFWDGRATSLEGQTQGPIQNKIEMGDQSYRQIVERLRTIPGYRDQFRRVFGTDVNLDGLAKAIACFERTALSGDSPYDRYMDREGDDPDDEATYGDLNLAEKRGMVLFGLRLHEDDPDREKLKVVLGRANCTACHAGSNFTDEMYHNLGVGYDPTKARFADRGRWVVAPIGTKTNAEQGAFKTPTLRDVARTGPYMHDGSESTLEAVVDFYNQGGIKNRELDPKMAPLNLSDGEKGDLVAFLKALNGRVVPVTVPTLPAGPDGTAPDPRTALNSPGANPTGSPVPAVTSARPHRAAGLR